MVVFGQIYNFPAILLNVDVFAYAFYHVLSLSFCLPLSYRINYFNIFSLSNILFFVATVTLFGNICNYLVKCNLIYLFANCYPYCLACFCHILLSYVPLFGHIYPYLPSLLIVNVQKGKNIL